MVGIRNLPNRKLHNLLAACSVGVLPIALTRLCYSRWLQRSHFLLDLLLLHLRLKKEEQSDTEDEQELQRTQTQKNGSPEGKERKSDTEEDVESDSDEDEDEDDADEMKNPAVKVPASEANHHQPDESESESGTDAGSSQHSPSASDFAIEPITSKLMNESTKSIKESGKRNLNMSPDSTPVKRVASKRASKGEAHEKESKKKKVSNGGDEDDGKKNSGYQRLWTEEDEIEILKGMIDYRTKKGTDPYADMGVFHEFVKKKVHANVSKNQVMDKLRRLKKKYQTYADKSVDGKDPILAKPHEQLAYDLSKKIWGPDSVESGEKNKKKTGTSTKAKNNGATPVMKKEVDTDGVVRAEANGVANVVGEESFCQNSALLSVLAAENITSDPKAASSFLRASLPLIDSAKLKDFDQKWKGLQREQVQFFMKKTSLLLDGAKLVLEAMKSDNG